MKCGQTFYLGHEWQRGGGMDQFMRGEFLGGGVRRSYVGKALAPWAEEEMNLPTPAALWGEWQL